ncbi:MAG: hypothetical protein WEB60_10635 [Terrimicrobiaceae bacterium]
MPIYEYFSPDTNKIYSFFARSLSSGTSIPRCPDDPKARMERVLSRFAVTGRAKEKTEESPSDPRMEKMMAEMEREMSSMDDKNPDPRQLGRLMRKMTEATGQKVPAEMEHMLRRLESGEDPEKLEEEFGESLDGLGEDGLGGDPESADFSSPIRAILKKRRPSRDPKLYELRDFLAESP